MSVKTQWAFHLDGCVCVTVFTYIFMIFVRFFGFDDFHYRLIVGVFSVGVFCYCPIFFFLIQVRQRYICCFV